MLKVKITETIDGIDKRKGSFCIFGSCYELNARLKMRVGVTDLYSDAEREYVRIKEKTSRWFHSTFPSLESIFDLEVQMVPHLEKEVRRIKVHRITGQNPMLEIRKIVQLFYFRERGVPTRLRDMNLYTREFIQHRNRQVFKRPVDHKPVLEALTDLVVHRLSLPENSPEEVFRNWLPQQFARALDAIPEPILLEGGFGKVCRIMGGVFLYALTDLPAQADNEYIKSRISQALKGGYYFGMFYPLIDDLMDHARVFTSQQKHELGNLLNHWIGGDFSVSNTLSSVDSMVLLENIMKEFHQLFPVEDHRDLYIAAYIQHFSQLEDVQKQFERNYSWDELYVPLIVKAAYTRILAAAISGIKLDEKLIDHMISTGLSFQLMDDFRDWITDDQHKLFTPFTYYINGFNQIDQINPFSLYLAVMKNYIDKFNGHKSLESQIMRRLSISIQRFSQTSTGDGCPETIQSILSHNQKVGHIVKKINTMKYRILDPDGDFTKPIDQVINRGR